MVPHLNAVDPTPGRIVLIFPLALTSAPSLTDSFEGVRGVLENANVIQKLWGFNGCKRV